MLLFGKIPQLLKLQGVLKVPVDPLPRLSGASTGVVWEEK